MADRSLDQDGDPLFNIKYNVLCLMQRQYLGLCEQYCTFYTTYNLITSDNIPQREHAVLTTQFTGKHKY